MKLRNKKTGEITSDISFIPADENRVAVCDVFRVIDTFYSSIADLCEEWEDYQDDKHWKPKPSEEYWYIGTDGIIYNESWLNSRLDKGRYAIGNCFRTKEEAEQAVEKLKAWKRLKDAGFKFTHVESTWQTRRHDCGTISFCIDSSQADKYADDIELLFDGGDE